MDIPQTGYGSWDEFRKRSGELAKDNKTGSGVYCECTPLPCVHGDFWAQRLGWVRAPDDTDHARVARG